MFRDRNCGIALYTDTEKTSSDRHSRLSAGEICNHFSISDAAVSRHLSVLKDADLIRDEREGKFIYYELNASVLEEIILWISELKGEDDYDQTT